MQYNTLKELREVKDTLEYLVHKVKALLPPEGNEEPVAKKKEIIAESPIGREVENTLSTFARVDPPLKHDKLHYSERDRMLWTSTKYRLETELWKRYNSVLIPWVSKVVEFLLVTGPILLAIATGG